MRGAPPSNCLIRRSSESPCTSTRSNKRNILFIDDWNVLGGDCCVNKIEAHPIDADYEDEGL